MSKNPRHVPRTAGWSNVYLMSTNSYTAQDVDVFDDVTHVRRFPFMYLGGDVRTTAVREVVDNAIDEARRALTASSKGNFADTVGVFFHDDGSIEVKDNGRGVPFDFDAKANINGIVKTLGTARAGANFNAETKGSTTGTHGVGAAACNFISTRFDVTVFRDGKMYRQQFRKGRPVIFDTAEFDPTASYTDAPHEKLQPVAAREIPADAPAHGTWVRFVLDDEVESGGDVDYDMVIRRAIVATALTPGLTLNYKRADDTDSSTFGPAATPGAPAVLNYIGDNEDEPLARFEAEFNFDKTTKSKQRITRPGTVDVALQLVAPGTDTESASVSAVNAVYTPGGGSHVTGATRGIGDVLANRSTRGLGLKNGEKAPSSEDYMAVVTMVVSATTPEPGFVGQEKFSVKNIAMGNALERELHKQVTAWSVQPANAKAVDEWAKAALNHARERRRVDDARKRARSEAAPTKGLAASLSMPDKLVNCKVQGRGSGAEIHLCEGDSALGTVANARYSDWQAVYPLKGKPKNVWGMALGKARNNSEFADIEKILGTGARDNCDPEKCNFDRIVFTTDGDVDGYHISGLLMLMFFENYKPLIDAGMVYISMPPLHVITVGKGAKMRKLYAVDDDERDDIYTRLTGEGVKDKDIDIQRCKGLGEMDAKDFRETVMNPDTRNLIRLTATEGDIDALRNAFGPNKYAAERRRMIVSALEAGLVDSDDLNN